MKTYLISDLHFGHKNILKFERTEFISIEEHDEFLIRVINQVVKPADLLYILGDIGDVDKVSRINGRKVLLMGNHDKRPIGEYLGYFAEVYETPIYLSERLVLSHRPIPVTAGTLNVHGHLHGSVLDSRNHFNVSAKLINYLPIELSILRSRVGNLEKDNHRFLEEWFAPLYKFTMPRTDVIYDELGRIKLEESLEHIAKLKQDSLGFVNDCLEVKK